jgi:hypothetical protein
VTLLETPWDHAYVLETLFVEILNEKAKNALMIGSDFE